MIERRINKSEVGKLQRNLKSGSVYAIRGRERTDDGIDVVLIEGKPRKDSDAARRSAWEAGKRWLAEIGSVKDTGSHYMATSD